MRDEMDNPYRDPKAGLPPRLRGQDEGREEVMHDLATEPARPLTDDEEHAARHDRTGGDRVFAPASERVPVQAIPGHAELIDRGLAMSGGERRRAAESVARETGAAPPEDWPRSAA